jgi:hypothetical protein
LFERLSPVNRLSSSDRVSTPLRRSLLDRRPAFGRLSSSVMRILHHIRRIWVVAKHAVNDPISTTSLVTRWVLFGLYSTLNSSRSTNRTRRKMSRKYMPQYVAEFQFRYNNRYNPDMFGTAIAGC